MPEQILKKLVWSEELATGIESIDYQHRKILGLLETLYDSASGVDGDFVRRLKRFSIQVMQHHESEEKLFEAKGNEHYLQQKQAHQYFIRSILKFINQSRAGELSPEECVRFYLKLCENTLLHIREDQQALGDNSPTGEGED
ncbi:hemerythrin domain-containing protein [Dongshaea marina]|uniref:hemerythrin domain-containing protein n=1 Tax=Dongshaea marina TaxID=2047966 RepID=UPI000D3ED98A|nr:hemerythrin domain-containing protein [Dongshaea marina]